MIPGEGDLRPMHYTVIWRCYKSTKRMHHVAFYAAIQARNACVVRAWFDAAIQARNACIMWRFTLLYKHERMCGLAPPSGHQRRRVRRRGWCAARRRCRRLAAPLCLLRRRLLASSTTTACASAAALWSHSCRRQQVRRSWYGLYKVHVSHGKDFVLLSCVWYVPKRKEARQLKSWKWSTFENVQQNELLHVDFSQSNLPFRRPLQVMCAQN